MTTANVEAHIAAPCITDLSHRLIPLYIANFSRATIQ